MSEYQISVADFAEWNRRIAQAAPRIADSDFPEFLVGAIRGVSRFKYALIVIYRREVPPIGYYHTFEGDAAQRAVKRFEEATYVLNPVYNAFLAGLKAGIYRITELAPDAYFTVDEFHSLEMRARNDEELGYRTPGWPAGLAELIIAIALPDGALAEISLSRPLDEGYDNSCVARIKLIEPVVSALFNMHWANVRANVVQVGKSLSLDDLLRDFGRDTLSEREREVAQLILRGHSGESISLQLGISVSTVKSHRKNLYAKLNLATQQELFSHFLKSLPLV